MMKIICVGCGKELPAEYGKEKHNEPCPYCGSTDRESKESYTDNISMHDGIKGT